MGRSLRRLDTEGRVVEVTARTVHGRYLLRPSPETKDIILGAMGRAQRLYPVEIFAFVWLSNHLHLLMRVLSALQMSRFMGHLKGNVAKELGRLQGWKEKFWGRRYHSASVADDEEVQLRRFLYILENGCKENLVDSPLEWPGASSAPALYRGEVTMTGTWYNRTAEYQARRRGEHKLFPSPETVYLSPPPFLEKLTVEQRRQFMVDAVRQVEEQTRERHRVDKTQALGIPAILRQKPQGKPKSFTSKPGPLFHTATAEQKQKLKEARAAFTAAYRAAAERLRRGEVDVMFPEGSFPPPQPFVEMRGPP